MGETGAYVWDMVVHFHKMFSTMHEALGDRVQFVIDTTFSGNSLSKVVELTEQALQQGVLNEHPDSKKQVEEALRYIDTNKILITRFFGLKP